MTVYSHSRIGTFETCPYQYKLRYIDRIKPEIQNTIEAFMGDMVHRSLEDLYKRKKSKKRVSKESLIKFYRDTWEKNYSEDIRIVKEGMEAKNYQKMGEKFLTDYYDTYKPFEQLTILGLETTDRMFLPDGNQWHVRIDKFACDDEGNYYVIDYKTNARMKDQTEADEDRQLAMYSIWVKNKFRDAKSVKLVWNMLAFNKEVVSERSDEELKKLQNEIVAKIKEIENAKEYPRNVTALCNYCGYKHICPSFSHQQQLKLKEDVVEYKADEGLKFVDELAEVKMKMQDLENKKDELTNKLIEFAKAKKLDVVYGSNMKCSVKDYKKVVLPEDREGLIKVLKDKGLWDEFVMLNYSRFNAKARKGELDEDVMKEVELGEDWRVGLSKRGDLD